MADQFDISQHIKVEALGFRNGIVNESYTDLIVNGVSYDASDYALQVISPDITTLESIVYPISYQGLMSYERITTSIYQVFWKPLQVGLNQSVRYKLYGYQSLDDPDYEDLWFGDNWHEIYNDPQTISTPYDLDFDGSKEGIRGFIVYNSDRATYGNFYQLKLYASVDNGTYNLIDVMVVEKPRPAPDNPNPDTSTFVEWSSDGDYERYIVQVSDGINPVTQYEVPITYLLEYDFDSDPYKDYYISSYPEIPTYSVRVDNLYLNATSYTITVLGEESDTTLTQITQKFVGQDLPGEEAYIAVRATGWWPIQCAVSSADITASYDVEKGLLKRPEPGTCRIVMQGAEGDPRTNSALAIDNKIRVLLDAAASPNDNEEYLFAGFIESVSTTYDVQGNITTSLNAIDAMSRVLNVNIPLYEYANDETFSRRMYNVFEDYIAPATFGVSYDDSIFELFEPYDGSAFPPEFRENVNSSEIITELTEGEYAVMAQNRGGVIFWWNRSTPALLISSETMTSQPASYGFSTVHDDDSLDHFCISDFTINNNVEDITNKVVASLSYDDLTQVVYTDPTSIGIYGERSFEVELNLDAPDGDPDFYLQRWVDEVPYSESQPEIQSITTNVVNRKGLVTKAFLTDINLDLLRVYIQVGPVDVNGVFFAKRITHRISPNNWTMELDLTAD